MIKKVLHALGTTGEKCDHVTAIQLQTTFVEKAGIWLAFHQTYHFGTAFCV